MAKYVDNAANRKLGRVGKEIPSRKGKAKAPAKPKSPKKPSPSPKKRKSSFAQLKSFDEDLYGSPKKKSPSPKPKGPRYLGDIEFGDRADRWWRKNRDKKKYEKMEEDLKDKELRKKGIDPKKATFYERQGVIDDARKVIRKFINEKILPKLAAEKPTFEDFYSKLIEDDFDEDYHSGEYGSYDKARAAARRDARKLYNEKYPPKKRKKKT
jgi:hypothetical protein